MPQAVERSGYKFGEQIFIALDAAASEFYDREQNRLHFQKIRRIETHGGRTGRILCETVRDNFPIISIEDGCAENDWDGWKKLTERLGDKIQLVGDDLFVTNVEFLRKGIDRGRGQFAS